MSDELTLDQVAYCNERAASRRKFWAAHRECRDATIEECAVNLAAWYPDNVSTNAFCAALRSMKSESPAAPK
jgi:hypothetical protein